MSAVTLPAMLMVNDLAVRYGKAVQALHGVDLELPDRGIVAVLGGNGAGKSTLLRAMSGTLGLHRGSVVRGQVTKDGERLDSLDPAEVVHRGVVQVPEGRQVFARMSVDENLKAGAASAEGGLSSLEQLCEALEAASRWRGTSSSPPDPPRSGSIRRHHDHGCFPIGVSAQLSRNPYTDRHLESVVPDMDDTALHRTLERHGGLITLDEARAAGLSATMVSDRVWSRRWQRVGPRTYFVAGHRWTDEARARAAVATTRGTLHGLSAAWWHGMVPELGDEVDVTVRRASNPRPLDGVQVRRRDLDRRDVVSVRDVAVTDRALTVLEAAVSLERGSAFLDRALQRWVSLDALRRAHERNPGRSGAAAAGRLLVAASDRAGSEAERVLLRMLRGAGFTGLRRGYHALGYELDVAFPASRVTVEVDGWAWHHGSDRFASDRVRQNALVSAGWTVLRYTWHQLHDEPERVLAEISGAVRRGLVTRPPFERP